MGHQLIRTFGVLGACLLIVGALAGCSGGPAPTAQDNAFDKEFAEAASKQQKDGTAGKRQGATVAPSPNGPAGAGIAPGIKTGG